MPPSECPPMTTLPPSLRAALDLAAQVLDADVHPPLLGERHARVGIGWKCVVIAGLVR